MPESRRVYRGHELAAEIAEQNARMREVVAEALEVLRTPLPDTFLGRKTREPFPEQEPSLDTTSETAQSAADHRPEERKPPSPPTPHLISPGST